MRNIDFNILLENNLLEKDGSSLIVLTPEERIQSIDPANFQSEIDKADYFYNMIKEGKLSNIVSFQGDKKLSKTLKKLSDSSRGSKKIYKLALESI